MRRHEYNIDFQHYAQESSKTACTRVPFLVLEAFHRAIHISGYVYMGEKACTILHENLSIREQLPTDLWPWHSTLSFYNSSCISFLDCQCTSKYMDKHKIGSRHHVDFSNVVLEAFHCVIHIHGRKLVRSYLRMLWIREQIRGTTHANANLLRALSTMHPFM